MRHERAQRPFATAGAAVSGLRLAATGAATTAGAIVSGLRTQDSRPEHFTAEGAIVAQEPVSCDRPQVDNGRTPGHAFIPETRLSAS